ncbi:DNA damage-regulated autophagy modulator protein 1-like [Convolutriloba macropyga]|uniref:DNA damage-regulated autophagy modulator protein 1-like n=1 Tax=Convolutriloba macropyga TaxID=536237 RepID=UPI003F52110E
MGAEECMEKIGLCLVAILAFVLAALTFVISYSISQARHFVNTTLPFISDTGAIAPASCWFGLFLNATAYTFLVIVIIRYLQVREQLGHGEFSAVKWTNIIALILGAIGTLGMSIVGCFQETSDIFMHLTGAQMAFGCAGVYGYLHSYLTFKLIKHTFYNHKWLLVIRIIISTICVITFILVIISMRKSGYQLPPYTEENGKHPYEHKGWYYTATTCEWTLAISFFLYVLSFAYEFSTVKIVAVMSTIPNSGIFGANPYAANNSLS